MASEEIVKSFETLPANFVPLIVNLIQPAAGLSYLYQSVLQNRRARMADTAPAATLATTVDDMDTTVSTFSV